MKYNTKWTIIGLFIPIVGIIIASRMTNKENSCSLRRGSAITTLAIFIALFFWFLIAMARSF